MLYIRLGTICHPKYSGTNHEFARSALKVISAHVPFLGTNRVTFPVGVWGTFREGANDCTERSPVDSRRATEAIPMSEARGRPASKVVLLVASCVSDQ